jgi:hypothetical protein
MKATHACRIVGYALEDSAKEGTIQVFAHLSEHTVPEVANLEAKLKELHRENVNLRRQFHDVVIEVRAGRERLEGDELNRQSARLVRWNRSEFR